MEKVEFGNNRKSIKFLVIFCINTMIILFTDFKYSNFYLFNL